MQQEVIIEKYLIAVEMWKDTRFDQLTEKDFAQSVQSVGLTSAEIQAIKQTCGRWTQQGEAYHQAGNWTQAVFYLEKSLQLEPFNVKLHLLLADCYKHLYIDSSKIEYLNRAVDLCKAGLNLDPTQQFFAQIETDLVALAEKRKRAKFYGWASVLSLGLGVWMGVWSFINLISWKKAFDGQYGGDFFSNLSNLFPLCLFVAGFLIAMLTAIIWVTRFSACKYHEQKLQKINFNPPIQTEKTVVDKIWEVVANVGKFLKG
jgi:hypothetical protein